MKNFLLKISLSVFITLFLFTSSFALSKEERRKKEQEGLQKQFEWWPTDAKPGPVKDPERGGYWWWPNQPGKVIPWGNRGYV